MAVLQAQPGESILAYVERYNRSGSGWTPDPALIPMAGTVVPSAPTTSLLPEPSPFLYDPLAPVPAAGDYPLAPVPDTGGTFRAGAWVLVGLVGIVLYSALAKKR